MTAPSLLLVDDDVTLRALLARELAERGFEVRVAGDVASAAALAADDPPELAVVDLRMPGGSGLELIDVLLGLDAHTRIVVLTGWGSVPTAVEALQRGAAHYLQKPVGVDELVAALTPDPPSPTASSSSSSSLSSSLSSSSSSLSSVELPSLARQEWEYIHRVLAECGGSISAASRQLKIHRRSLQRKLQKHPPAR